MLVVIAFDQALCYFSSWNTLLLFGQFTELYCWAVDGESAERFSTAVLWLRIKPTTLVTCMPECSVLQRLQYVARGVWFAVSCVSERCCYCTERAGEAAFWRPTVCCHRWLWPRYSYTTPRVSQPLACLYLAHAYVRYNAITSSWCVRSSPLVVIFCCHHNHHQRDEINVV